MNRRPVDGSRVSHKFDWSLTIIICKYQILSTMDALFYIVHKNFIQIFFLKQSFKVAYTSGPIFKKKYEAVPYIFFTNN